MPRYIVCQRICQLKSQLIPSPYSSWGYKNRILDGFWNIRHILFLKGEAWNWLFSFLKEKKKSNSLGLWCFSFGICPKVCDFSMYAYMCTHVDHVHICTHQYRSVYCRFSVELRQTFSSSKQGIISFLPWSDGWFEQLGRVRARKPLIYLLLNWFRQMPEDDTSLN